MKNNFILALISSLLIVSAFFLGYYYEKNEHIDDKNTILNTKYQVNLKKTKEKLEISNPNKNIDLYINGEQISSGTYTINN